MKASVQLTLLTTPSLASWATKAKTRSRLDLSLAFSNMTLYRWLTAVCVMALGKEASFHCSRASLVDSLLRSASRIVSTLAKTSSRVVPFLDTEFWDVLLCFFSIKIGACITFPEAGGRAGPLGNRDGTGSKMFGAELSEPGLSELELLEK